MTLFFVCKLQFFCNSKVKIFAKSAYLSHDDIAYDRHESLENDHKTLVWGMKHISDIVTYEHKIKVHTLQFNSVLFW